MIKKIEYDMMSREKSLLFINIYTFQLGFQLNKKKSKCYILYKRV